MTIRILTTKQINPEWWEAAGFNINAPNARDTFYYTHGKTEFGAILALIRSLIGQTKR